mgnify:CR=1 FL=1
MDNNNKFRIRHLQFSRIYINEKKISIFNFEYELWILGFSTTKIFLLLSKLFVSKKLAKNVFFYVISFEILLQIFI